MPDIKTKDVVLGTIKTVDRSALAGQRMKNAYVHARNKAEQSVSSSESNSEEYAADRITEATADIAREAVHQMDTLGQQVVGQTVSKPQTPPAQAESFTQNAQQPHQTTDGASSVISPDVSASKQEAPSPKQTYIRRKRKSVQAAEQSKKTTLQFPKQQPAPTMPTIKDASSVASQSIKTVENSGKTIKQSAGAAGKTIKTAAHTINSVEQTGSAAIKTAEVSFHMGQRAAIESARATQRIRAAAKAAASTAKALTAATAKALRAIIAAAQELTTAFIAGGGTVLVMVVIMIVMCFAGMMLASDEDDTEILPISAEVLAYEPIIQQYAREHGIGDYVLLIQAVMMQESGGRGNDPMQCSECNFNTLYPHVPGGITDPEYSINVGIQNLADCLCIAQCESPMDMDAVKLALQGYNYGQGYITWAMNKYGEYSKANAIEFSMKTAEQYGWNRYGDMDYVSHVLRYYPLGQIFYDPDTSTLIIEVARSQIGNVGGEPYWSWYGFTERVDWCACFVSWCANQCGYIEAGVIPKFSGCEWGVYWFRQHDQWAGRNITPTPGMIIFFDWEDEESGGLDGSADHVGIVQRVENGRVYTIEGNTADSCQERSYSLRHFEILGYGVLAY
ncbi:MAG: lysozyme family protein [Oscillospiraceae bacterium]